MAEVVVDARLLEGLGERIAWIHPAGMELALVAVDIMPAAACFVHPDHRVALVDDDDGRIEVLIALPDHDEGLVLRRGGLDQGERDRLREMLAAPVLRPSGRG